MVNKLVLGAISLVLAGFLLIKFYSNIYPTANNLPAKIKGNQFIKNNQETVVNFFLEITNPKDQTTVNNSIINITGKTVKNAEVYVNEKEVQADSNGNFSLDYELFEGKNDLYITANDEKGNYIEKMITVNLETKE